MIRILVVDDSALMRKLLGRLFSAEPDFEVQVARNGLEALDQLLVFEPDVITLDIHMPDMDGLACLDTIMIRRPCPVVMVSSLTAAGADATLEALRLGAIDFAAKPSGAVSLKMDQFGRELLRKVRSAAGAKLRLATRLRERVHHRIGTSARAQAVATAPRSRGKLSEVARGDGLVVVGTSTGGPPALEALLTPLRADFRWPLVIAQHMPTSFTGALARRLDGLCQIDVVEVTGPVPLKAGCAYIGRGEADVVISRRSGVLTAMTAPAQAHYPWHPSTDRLVRSAMDHVPATQLVGILMTGMGNDGAEAMTLLKREGGRTIAEAEETAVVWGMPGELVRANGASAILPVHEIAICLQEMVG